MHWGSSIIISTCQKMHIVFYPDSSSLVCFILAYLLDEVKLIQNGCEFWDTDSLMGLSCSLTYFCIVWRCVTVKRKGMTSNMMCCYRKCEQAAESSKTESNPSDVVFVFPAECYFGSYGPFLMPLLSSNDWSFVPTRHKGIVRI